MKPPPFRYVRPKTLAEVLALLSASAGEAKLIAGGQSLLPLLNLRLVRPAVLVDVALVPELQVLGRDGDELVIGAGVRQRTAETSAVVREACPLIPLALGFVGHVQIRCRGTIGGSLAHADPAAELPGVAVALDAALVAVGPRGRRVVSARDFFLGPHTTALTQDEVLTEVRLPILSETRSAFLEVAPRFGDPAIAGVAAAVRVADGRVTEARIAAIGVGGAPLRLPSAEEAALDGSLEPAHRERIAAAAAQGMEPATGYRHRLVRTLVSRALAKVAA